MHTLPAANPFALLLNPAAVLEQVERSERLGRLQSRICRPLDKPLNGASEGASADARDDTLDTGV